MNTYSTTWQELTPEKQLKILLIKLCHPKTALNFTILKLAFLYQELGLSYKQFNNDLSILLKKNTRRQEKPGELQRQWNFALGKESAQAVTYPAPNIDTDALMENMLSNTEFTSFDNFKTLSDISIPDTGKEQLQLFLSTHFQPEDNVFIGDIYSKPEEHIFSVYDWIEGLRDNPQEILEDCPQMCINPLSGQYHPKKDSSKDISMRCDNAVSKLAYCLCEFDDMPITDQIRFWEAAIKKKLPIAPSALIFSGSKSLHAVIPINVKDHDEWDYLVRQQYYHEFLIPLGADRACCNPSRLFRTPGALRDGDPTRMQKLIYISKL